MESAIVRTLRRVNARGSAVFGVGILVAVAGALASLALAPHTRTVFAFGVGPLFAIVFGSFWPRKRRDHFSVHACGRSDVGRVRANNEDAFVIADLTNGSIATDSAEWAVGKAGVLLAVADGMGGENAGEVASAMALDALREHLAENVSSTDGATRLAAAISHANEVVIGGGGNWDHEGMGATLAVALVSRQTVCVASVGDARVYLLRGDRFQQITHDQSFVQLLIDAGTVTPEQAREQPNKNVVLQAIGKNEALDLQIGSFDPRRGDRLLLCSDGLSGLVPAAQIHAIVRNESPRVACDEAIDAANAAGGEDNVTAVVAALHGEGYSAPADEEFVIRRTRPLGRVRRAK